MPKKEEKKVKTAFQSTKRERQIKVFKDNVYKLFDREPNGSIVGDVGALIDKINKA